MDSPSLLLMCVLSAEAKFSVFLLASSSFPFDFFFLFIFDVRIFIVFHCKIFKCSSHTMYLPA